MLHPLGYSRYDMRYLLFIFLFLEVMVPGSPGQNTGMRDAANYIGSDCSQKIQAADRDLGTGSGTILITRACGHTLLGRIEVRHPLVWNPGTWVLSAPSPQITLHAGSGLYGTSRQTTLQMAPGTNAQMMIWIPSSSSKVVIEGMTLDGNRSSNIGPYPFGQALIWVGDNNSLGESVDTIIRGNTFMSPCCNAIFVNRVSNVSILNNTGIDIGGDFVHAGGAPLEKTYTSNLSILGNMFDYGRRSILSTANVRGSTMTWVSGQRFSTTLGKEGFDQVVTIISREIRFAQHLIESCSSDTICNLYSSPGDVTNVLVGVGNSFGVRYINVNSTNIQNNVIKSGDGSLEAINVTVGSFNNISGNNILFPQPHTLGAEGITLANDQTGGDTNYNLISGNTIVNPFSTGVAVQVHNTREGSLRGNMVTGNLIVDANSGNDLPPKGYDAGIRLAGIATTDTQISNNECISTRTGLTPPRMGFDYCIELEQSEPPLNTVIGLNWFHAADTSGTVGLVKDGGRGTKIATFATDGAHYTVNQGLQINTQTPGTLISATSGSNGFTFSVEGGMSVWKDPSASDMTWLQADPVSAGGSLHLLGGANLPASAQIFLARNLVPSSPGTLSLGTIPSPFGAVSALGLTLGRGSMLTGASVYATGDIAPSLVAPHSCSDQAFSVPGLDPSDKISAVTPPMGLGAISLLAYPSERDAILFHFCNASTGEVMPPAGSYTFLAIR